MAPSILTSQFSEVTLVMLVKVARLSTVKFAEAFGTPGIVRYGPCLSTLHH